MTDAQIVSEAPIDVYTLKKELEKIRKRDNELNFRANRTEDYLHQIAILKNAEELFNKIMQLNIPRLKEQHIHKIIDITPTTINDLKVALQGYTITLNNESSMGLMPSNSSITKGLTINFDLVSGLLSLPSSTYPCSASSNISEPEPVPNFSFILLKNPIKITFILYF